MPRTEKTGFWSDVNHYWFGFGSPVSLGVFRILASTVLLFNFFLLSFDFKTWFTENGFVPIALNDKANPKIDSVFTIYKYVVHVPFQVPRINLLAYVTDARITLLFWIVAIIATFFTLVGYKTRISSIIMAIAVVSIQSRNILILHGGDTIMRISALYIAIAPSGAACSLDRIIALWRNRQIGPPRMVSMWPQRIIQYNLALVYFTTWWYKMDGNLWRNGTAIWYTSRLKEFYRFPYPDIVRTIGVSRVLSFATVIVELSMGTLVFYKPARKYVLFGGLMLHATIEYTMNIPLFSAGICAMYICFYEGDEVSAWAERCKLWWVKRMPKLARFVQCPAGFTFNPPHLAAIEALHPVAKVEYATGDGPALAILDGNKKPTRWMATIAKPIGLIPGLWKHLVLKSIVREDDLPKQNGNGGSTSQKKKSGKILVEPKANPWGREA